jgi:hypothetical protein
MKASFSTTTTFLIVAFGMMTFLFFGIHAFSNISHSANVVAENIEYLNAIDAAHMLKACLEGSDGIITRGEPGGSDLYYSCSSRFSGLSGLRYEYRIVDAQEKTTLAESPGYRDTESAYSHAIYINIVTENGDVHLGRLYVKTVET